MKRSHSTSKVKQLFVFYTPSPGMPTQEVKTAACSVTGAVINAKTYAPRKVKEFTVFDPEQGTVTDTVIFGPALQISGKRVWHVAITNEEKA